MAPFSMRSLDQQQQQQTTSGLRKLRKPVIEKMRRDRINSSIEQLRLLLEKELQGQQLPSRAEKADILELAVTFLQQHVSERGVTASSQAHGEGYSSCVRDSVTFLSLHRQTQLQSQLLQNLPGTPSKQSAPDSSKALWRPW